MFSSTDGKAMGKGRCVKGTTDLIADLIRMTFADLRIPINKQNIWSTVRHRNGKGQSRSMD
jgi:hypothetical protein